MKQQLLISFSGGRTSAYMAQWLLSNISDKYNIMVVFANTGEEDDATLEFVKKCDEYFGFNTVWIEAVARVKRLVNGEKHIFTIWEWKRIERKLRKDGYTQHWIDERYTSSPMGVEAKVVDFETADREGGPFRAMIAKQGIPNSKYLHCSRDLKQRAIRAYARDIGWKGYYTAIGIRNDEVDRVSNAWREEKLIYPLISLQPTTRLDVNGFWADMPFDLEIKSYEGNCKVCWKKSLRKLLTIAKEHPERFDNFGKWEKEYENYAPPGRLKNLAKRGEDPGFPYRFFREKLTVAQILEMSTGDFELVKDDSKEVGEYKESQLEGHDLDLSDGCVESCEVF